MNFLIQRIWKVNFFIKNLNLTKTNLVVGRRRGGGVARVSEFFSKNPNLKKNLFLGGSGGGGGEG